MSNDPAGHRRKGRQVGRAGQRSGFTMTRQHEDLRLVAPDDHGLWGEATKEVFERHLGMARIANRAQMEAIVEDLEADGWMVVDREAGWPWPVRLTWPAGKRHIN